MTPTGLCWIDGQRLPAQDARISVYDHGLLYGDGIFEGLRFYRRRPFRLDAHLARLHRSAAALRIALPYSDDELRAAVTGLCADFPEESGYLRIIVTRGVGNLGLNPANCARPSVILIADRLALVSDEKRNQGVRLITAATRRPTITGLDPRIKSLNYLHSILARMEAEVAGADEALLLNEAGRVAECSAENLFVVRDGQLLTPPTSEGALGGITRGLILSLAEGLGIPTAEAQLTTYDIYTADECFLTGSGARLIPVRELDGRPIPCPGPLYRRLGEAYEAAIQAEIGL